MGELSNLEPKRVFYYFEEITKIPHGSYNVDKISDYIYNFGKSHGFETYQDEYKNVIIIKEASAGYENEPAIILQGHMDMVAVHKPELNIDMKVDGLKAFADLEKDYVYAEGTSLGGDDGIAVAYALAILEDDSLMHPRLEVVITTNEETGMEGATGIDLSMLKGKRLLNLDSEDEGIFLAGCAGGLKLDVKVPAWTQPVLGSLYEVEIGGLLGGHSGSEIDKDRGNALKLAARFLYMLMNAEAKRANDELVKSCGNVTKKAREEIFLTHINGGEADNAIPREVHFGVLAKYADVFEDTICEFISAVSSELAVKDPAFYCKYSNRGIMDTSAYECSDAVRFLYAIPNGVQGVSREIKGLIETSLNLGIVKFPTDSRACGSDDIYAAISVRSSIESCKKELAQKVSCIAKMAGGSVSFHGEYPGWEYKADSKLREKMINLYRDMYGKEPTVTVIHAGLECGLLSAKIDGLDCVSIGPDMKDIHTTEEKLSISSTKRVYEFVTRLLAMKD